LKEDERVTERELSEFTAARLAPFKVPRPIFFVPSIPKTASGKPKRLELTRRFGEALVAARCLVKAGLGTPGQRHQLHITGIARPTDERSNGGVVVYVVNIANEVIG